MGHPRLGEMMSRQRLCGDVLLASLNALSAFVFVKFYHSRAAPIKAAESASHARPATPSFGRALFKEQSQRVACSSNDSVVLWSRLFTARRHSGRAPSSPKLSCSLAQIRQAAA
jgi:hypothetical protein